MTPVGRKNRKRIALPESSQADVPAAFSKASAGSNRRGPNRKSSILSLAVVAVVVPGLFTTLALPAYAFAPPSSADATAGAKATQQLQQLKTDNAQSVYVATDAASTAVSRDAFSATSAAEIQRAALAVSYAAYSGPTVSDFLANPPHPKFDLNQVVAVALQYRGVPYRYGGADPSGFDCSGFVMFVYAQFGISLPHSVSGSAAVGTAISRDAALPGDIVILPGHSGIYMGNGTFIDAGDYGEVITVRPIYENDYYIVRFGI